MTNELKKPFTELYVILNNLTYENYTKIPNEVIELIENNKDEEYKFVYDYELDLNEQKISKLTRVCLAKIYDNYILDN